MWRGKWNKMCGDDTLQECRVFFCGFCEILNILVETQAEYLLIFSKM